MLAGEVGCNGLELSISLISHNIVQIDKPISGGGELGGVGEELLGLPYDCCLIYTCPSGTAQDLQTYSN